MNPRKSLLAVTLVLSMLLAFAFFQVQKPLFSPHGKYTCPCQIESSLTETALPEPAAK